MGSSRPRCIRGVEGYARLNGRNLLPGDLKAQDEAAMYQSGTSDKRTTKGGKILWRGTGVVVVADRGPSRTHEPRSCRAAPTNGVARKSENQSHSELNHPAARPIEYLSGGDNRETAIAAVSDRRDRISEVEMVESVKPVCF